jgi:Holliday junction resolvase RusA-like endonuclease
VIRFRVNGRPAPQGSKRHVGNGRMVESSKAVDPWREAVRAEVQRITGNGSQQALDTGFPPLHDPVSLRLIFVLARPKGHYGNGRNSDRVKPSAPHRPAGRPDVDKLARAVLDGLTMGGAFADDAQVVDLDVSKHWCEPGETPGVVIEIDEAK